MSQKLLSRDPGVEMRKAFKLFDAENKGKITLDDLKRVMKEVSTHHGYQCHDVPS